ncbi:hypothetical protein HK405_012859 [Cladochytrium tenue]|nr:hypothetical protein HK405_012859 [Cladochytrium tenue]
MPDPTPPPLPPPPSRSTHAAAGAAAAGSMRTRPQAATVRATPATTTAKALSATPSDAAAAVAAALHAAPEALPSAHRRQLTALARFARLQRTQAAREMAAAFADALDRHLPPSSADRGGDDDTGVIAAAVFSAGDVRAIVAHDLLPLAQATLTCELARIAAAAIAVAHQYLHAALRDSGLVLEGNVDVLEDRSVLAAAAMVEEHLLAAPGNVTQAADPPPSLPRSPTQPSESLPSDTTATDPPPEDAEKAELRRRVITLEAEVRRLRERDRLKSTVQTLEADLADRLHRATPVRNLLDIMHRKDAAVELLRRKLASLDPSALDEPVAE